MPLFSLVTILFNVWMMLASGMAAEPVENIPEEAAELVPETLNDARMAVAIKQQLSRAGGKAFSSITVEVKDGIATLLGTADSLWALQRAKEIAHKIRGVRGVIDRMLMGPVGVTDDAVLKDYLETLFLDDSMLAMKDIRISVKRGRVTLEGYVQSWQEKQAAINAAKMVKGVREVRDKLTVRFVKGRTDADIHKDVARRVAFDVWVEQPELLKIHVRQGKVVLGGEVRSVFEKHRVAELGWVDGVREVDATGIEVALMSQDPMVRTHRPMPGDREIAEAVRLVLAYDPRVSPFHIHITVKDRSVTLQGQVPFLSIKQHVEQNVLNTLGVQAVHNRLTVASSDTLNDQEVAARLRKAFFHDPVLEKFALAVSVRKGAVLLSGTVDSIYERNHAENLASTIPGVQSIQNHLTFSSNEEKKNDWEIQLDFENQIWWNLFLSQQDIVANVENGKAVLSGTVEFPYQRVIAEQQAFEAGASVVRNRLKVKAYQFSPD